MWLCYFIHYVILWSPYQVACECVCMCVATYVYTPVSLDVSLCVVCLWVCVHVCACLTLYTCLFRCVHVCNAACVYSTWRAYPIDEYPCRTRQAAAIMHMIMNNLNPAVAQVTGQSPCLLPPLIVVDLQCICTRNSALCEIEKYRHQTLTCRDAVAIY